MSPCDHVAAFKCARPCPSTTASSRRDMAAQSVHLTAERDAKRTNLQAELDQVTKVCKPWALDCDPFRIGASRAGFLSPQEVEATKASIAADKARAVAEKAEIKKHNDAIKALRAQHKSVRLKLIQGVPQCRWSVSSAASKCDFVLCRPLQTRHTLDVASSAHMELLSQIKVSVTT